MAEMPSRRVRSVSGRVEATGLRPATRALAWSLAVLTLSAGAWLAWHYPIARPAAPIGFALFAALFATAAASYPPGVKSMINNRRIINVSFIIIVGYIKMVEC